MLKSMQLLSESHRSSQPSKRNIGIQLTLFVHTKLATPKQLPAKKNELKSII